MLTALITGVSGFCGRHLANRLLKERYIRVIGVSRTNRPDEADRAYERIQLDICEGDQVAGVVRKVRPEFIFHLAGLMSGSAEAVYRTNVLGTVNLLESVCKHAPEARVLLAGSAAEYGNVESSSLPVTEDHPCQPIGAYGVSKHAMTLIGLDYAKRLKMKIVIARPFNIVGPGISSSLVIGAVLSRAKHALETQHKPVVMVGQLDTMRDFVAVEDVVDAYCRMIQGEYWGQVFNICAGQAFSIRKVVDLLLSHFSRSIEFEIDPSLVRSSDTTTLYGSLEKANQAFGFRPSIPLEYSIRAAWEYEMRHVV